jgi:hypothetical protein
MLGNEFSDHLSVLGDNNWLSIFVNLIDEAEAFGFKLGDGYGHRVTSNSYWSFLQNSFGGFPGCRYEMRIAKSGLRYEMRIAKSGLRNCRCPNPHLSRSAIPQFRNPKSAFRISNPHFSIANHLQKLFPWVFLPSCEFAFRWPFWSFGCFRFSIAMPGWRS